MEETVYIPADHGQLEGQYKAIDKNKVVIITHPHPLYGGDMYNSVVHTMTRTFQQLACSTLRFNFRGVGKSSGKYDDGIGEQDDIKSAINFLRDKGYSRCVLAGYSFGSWVIYNLAASNAEKFDMVFVSPPVDFINFENSQALESLKMVLVGSRDEFASLASIERIVPKWNPGAHLEIIEGADHFYSGYLEQIENALTNVFQI